MLRGGAASTQDFSPCKHDPVPLKSKRLLTSAVSSLAGWSWLMQADKPKECALHNTVVSISSSSILFQLVGESGVTLRVIQEKEYFMSSDVRKSSFAQCHE